MAAKEVAVGLTTAAETAVAAAATRDGAASPQLRQHGGSSHANSLKLHCATKRGSVYSNSIGIAPGVFRND
jgi:hypothetical protein